MKQASKDFTTQCSSEQRISEQEKFNNIVKRYDINLVEKEKWTKYSNGNYLVYIDGEGQGTKIRISVDDYFKADFPENIDIAFSKKCLMGCKYCHEGCTPTGQEADIKKYVEDKNSFLYTLRPGTELAIGVNHPIHPDLELLLETCKDRGLFANVTVHQVTLEQNVDKIQYWLDNKYLRGIGVSLQEQSQQVIDFAIKNPTTVIHTINGVTPTALYKSLFDKNLKVLVLGYKEFRRGLKYKTNNRELIKNNQNWLYDELEEFIKHFKVVSFDNLALEQLDPKRLLTDSQWEEMYMGNDGQHTMYIDLVNELFAQNSCWPEEKRLPLTSSIDDMFNIVKEMK